MERMIWCADRCRQAGVNGRFLAVCLFLLIAALFFMISCSGHQVQKSPAKGVYHVVKKGETAYSIARAYSISMQDMAEVNNIIDVSSIKEGSVIFIPDADQVIDDVMTHAGKIGADMPRDTGPKRGKVPDSAAPDSPPVKEKGPSLHSTSPGEPAVAPPPVAGDKNETKAEEKVPIDEKKDEVTREKGRFVWPVRGTVKTRFGIQPNKTYYNWIKIACPSGASVKAAASGTVIFSANLKDFGETIIIRHANDFATVYTHVQKKYVKVDQPIKKGDSIAVAGVTDEAGATYVNFEIRLKGKARNPLFYLP